MGNFSNEKKYPKRLEWKNGSVILMLSLSLVIHYLLFKEMEDLLEIINFDSYRGLDYVSFPFDVYFE